MTAQTAPSVPALLGQAEALLQKDRFAEATPLLQEAVKADPRNVEVLYRLGYVYFRQRRLTEARAQFGAVIDLAPPAYFSRYFLGRIALIENKPGEAVKWLEPIVNDRQQIFDSGAQLAAAYVGAGKPRHAIAPLKLSIGQMPWDSNLYYRLGRLHQQLGEAELAKEAFSTSSRLKSANREDVETLMSVSRALGEGNAAGATEAAGRLASRAEADPDSLVALGVLYGGANLVEPAVEVFRKAAERNPALFQAQFNLGLALLRGNRAVEALGPLERAVKLLPQSTEANITYGLAAVMNQDYARAIAPLERAWSMDRSSVRVGSLLATAYLRTKAPAKAVPLLRSLAGQENTDATPLLLLVEALNATEDQVGALEAAQTAQRKFPQMAQVQMAAAQQLARMGRYQEARPVFQDALKAAPGQPEAELGLADCLQKAGEQEEAVFHYRAALPAPTTALAARTGLARSLIAMRRLEESLEALEEGISAYPESVPLRLELSRVLARLGKPDLAAEQTRIIERLKQ